MIPLSIFKSVADCLFCLGADGFSHPSPALPTDSNFDSLFKQFTSFIFGSEESSGQVLSAELQGGSGYQVSLKCSPFSVCLKLIVSFSADGWCFQYGDVMMTAGGRGHRGMFFLPAPGVTAYCMDTSAAGNYYSP